MTRVLRSVLVASDAMIIMAPVLAVHVAATRGGLASTVHGDLFVASAALAAIHASFLWARLGFDTTKPIPRRDWIAALNTIVVLAIGTNAGLAGTLYRYADPLAESVETGVPTVVIWLGLSSTAIAVAELAGHLTRRWLDGQRPGHRLSG